MKFTLPQQWSLKLKESVVVSQSERDKLSHVMDMQGKTEENRNRKALIFHFHSFV